MSQSRGRSLAPFRHSATPTTPFAAVAADTTTTTVSSAQLETPFWRNSRRRFRYLEFGEWFFSRYVRRDDRGAAPRARVRRGDVHASSGHRVAAIVFGHVIARNRPWAVRNGAKIRVHQTSWTDPARCRGDVTCVCLQACEHARHVLSEEARSGEERSGVERRGETW